MRDARTPRLIVLLALLPLCSCAVGPNYRRPEAPASPAYKEDNGWKPGNPSEPANDAAWWSIYNDPVLDTLERKIDISNQSVKAAEAAYRAAQAAVGIDRGSLLPTLTATGAQSRRGGNASNALTSTSVGTGSTGLPTSSGSRTTYSAALGGSWQIDLWGRIRRTVESDVARAQVSAADLAAARLSAQSTLAQDYFLMRAADEQKRLLDASVEAFRASLQIAQNRLKAGVTTVADVYTAQTELENTQAQATNALLTRARYEHAIAVLTGVTPAELSLATGAFATNVPVVPVGMPSTLLERRPDVAAAERSVASANALIGVARSAWFPSLTLSGSYGFTSDALAGLLNTGNSVWSLGPSLAETIFNGGARIAQNQQARANYDQAVANYRETVLTALQQVEDDLVSLRVLQEQYGLQETAVADARRSEELVLNQYRAGTADYSSVITAQTTRVNSEISLLSIQSQRLTASIELTTALGGGWSMAQLPQPNLLYSLPKSP
jgi:NodT family efflux transporter outer membrane factor (OMF) lipoprotein